MSTRNRTPVVIVDLHPGKNCQINDISDVSAFDKSIKTNCDFMIRVKSSNSEKWLAGCPDDKFYVAFSRKAYDEEMAKWMMLGLAAKLEIDAEIDILSIENFPKKPLAIWKDDSPVFLVEFTDPLA